MRILLAEDDAAIREVLHEALRGGGHQVTLAAAQPAALALLAGAAWDLLISDVLLPGGSGEALAAAAARRGINCLVITGSPQVMHELQRRGVPFLRKPFTLAELAQRIGATTRR